MSRLSSRARFSEDRREGANSSGLGKGRAMLGVWETSTSKTSWTQRVKLVRRALFKGYLEI